MKRVVVTLTTVPARLADVGPEGIKLCIDSLIEQNYENFEIHFNIPKINKYTGEAYRIPKWLIECDRVKAFRVEDRGPVTKLLPTVRRIKDPSVVIVVVDDDMVYHPDMILAHVDNQRKWPKCVVGYDGLRSRADNGEFSNYYGNPRDYYFTANCRSSKVDILQHYKSVSYLRRYFENDFFQFIDENHSWDDDLLLAAYWSYKKRDRIATYHLTDEEYSTLEEWNEGVCQSSFPIVRSTNHEIDGCNALRLEEVENNSEVLYSYVDFGYSITEED